MFQKIIICALTLFFWQSVLASESNTTCIEEPLGFDKVVVTCKGLIDEMTNEEFNKLNSEGCKMDMGLDTFTYTCIETVTYDNDETVSL